jgi:dnd system-associated protein 4
MRRNARFVKDRSIYWPSEYADIVNVLTGKLADGSPGGVGALYQFNTGAIVLAAAIGLANGRLREVGPDRKEITTTTFTSHELDAYIFLIALLSKKEVDSSMLRPENEEAVVRIFEKYAAGGLEILRRVFDESPTQSAEIVIQQYLPSLEISTVKRIPLNLDFATKS